MEIIHSQEWTDPHALFIASAFAKTASVGQVTGALR
jgi:hypothetical protein